MRSLSTPSESMMSTVGVHTAPKRWKYLGCSLMCASTATKFSLMKKETSGSAYDSASSRAHAPQAGAALKSTRRGLFSAFACDRAASASLLHSTAIFVDPPEVEMEGALLAPLPDCASLTFASTGAAMIAELRKPALLCQVEEHDLGFF